MGLVPFDQAVKEMREHMEINGGCDGDSDAIDALMDDCGRDSSGSCSMAGSEYCDFECPFS